MFKDLKVGDKAVRMLAGTVPCELIISGVTESRIICGPWEFDIVTGAEIDDDLNWGPPPKMTGSFLKREEVQSIIQEN